MGQFSRDFSSGVMTQPSSAYVLVNALVWTTRG
jgi:hypothetical protein